MPATIYFDNNATTPIDPRVLDAMRPVFEKHYGNPASSTHTFGWYAEELVQIAREQVAAALNSSPAEVVFTSGATEANNLALKGLGQPADGRHRIISCRCEHKSVLDPLARLAARGFEVSQVGVDENGAIRRDEFRLLLDDRTALVSLMLANNEIGTIHDIAALAREAKNCGALFHCDATQALGKIALDVEQLGADLLSLSAHKAYGPKGIGALYVRRGVELEPLIEGGGHESGLRSGTLNVPAIVGFGKACALAQAELSSDVERIAGLTARLLDGLKGGISDLRLNGAASPRLPGNLNVLLPGVDNARLIGLISTKIALSTTSACQSHTAASGGAPSHVLAALGLSERDQRSSVRIGLGRFTTASEVDAAASILAGAVAKIRAA